MKSSTLALGLLFVALASPAAELTPLHHLTRSQLTGRVRADARSVHAHRNGLLAVIAFMDGQTNLFPALKPGGTPLLRREEKEVVWRLWERFLDYTAALDSTERYHADWFRLKGVAREDCFVIQRAAQLAKYRFALEFIERCERNSALDKVLNDAVPELGLPARTYAGLKFRYLNVQTAAEFAASEALAKTLAGDRLPHLRADIDQDEAFLWQAGKGRGEKLTAKNALKVMRDGANSTWLPIQAGISEWMGDTKVYRVGRSLVSEKQIRELQPDLQPGDVILTRREWYMSNVGLPGFWPHAALYIGTPADRRAVFTDAETEAWVKQQGEASGDLEVLLQGRHPKAYQQSLTPREQGHLVRVIEAISEGVSFTSLEHSADCDSLAVLRPRLSRTEKTQALMRAFHYAGRPYDFNFDFATDAELVCTELVFKAYEPAGGFTGLTLPLVEMLGRKVTPANEIVKQFDAQSGMSRQQFDLVIFLDGQERSGRAVKAAEAEFRASWRRPKWHVLTAR